VALGNKHDEHVDRQKKWKKGIDEEAQKARQESQSFFNQNKAALSLGGIGTALGGILGLAYATFSKDTDYVTYGAMFAAVVGGLGYMIGSLISRSDNNDNDGANNTPAASTPAPGA